MSIVGPGVLFRLRAGGSTPGLTNTRSGATATYLSSAGILSTAAADLLRTDWVDTNSDGVLDNPVYRIESAGTNWMLWSRDCTNAAWTRVNCNAAKTQTGIDGAASSATLLTATAGNATCLQTVASVAADRMFSAFVKRVTGSGNIQMTLDNGGTWTTIAITNVYKRFAIPTQNVANPTVGFRIVTNTDAIVVDYCQLEFSKIQTSPILTTTASANRSVDNVSATFPFRPAALTVYLRYLAQDVTTPSVVLCEIGSINGGNPRFGIEVSGGGVYAALHNNFVATQVTATAGSIPTYGQVVEARGVLQSDGSVIFGQSIASGPESVSAASGALALDGAWNATKVSIGSLNGSTACALGLMNLLVLSGVRSMDGCRALV